MRGVWPTGVDFFRLMMAQETLLRLLFLGGKGGGDWDGWEDETRVLFEMVLRKDKKKEGGREEVKIDDVRCPPPSRRPAQTPSTT